VGQPFQIFHQSSKSILTTTTGFIAEAGFTHSLTPARNCTFGCTYCYVPTMRIYGGLQPRDWTHWGQFTTFKQNAAELLRRQVRSGMIVYCSPLVDPYQPAEAEEQMMPRLLEVLIAKPPLVFTIQTRGPLILRDLAHLLRLNRVTKLRVSFSVTTDDEAVRRLYEPHCAPIDERLQVIRTLEQAGIQTHATVAPLLPCDSDTLVDALLAATPRDIVGDPLHLRATKRHGATTREQAFRIAEHHGHQAWFEPTHQALIVERMKERATRAGRRFHIGPEAFAWLAQPNPPSPVS
jgi:DNA repair photolyase